MSENCKLCDNINNSNEDSHIIPNFFYRWLKETSPTGYMRNTIKPNLRVQDGLKCKFLCENCEDVLSKIEKQFADKIFYPMVNNEEKFIYECKDEWILKFGVSVTWRVLKYLNINGMISNITEEEHNIINDTLTLWGEFLLNKSNDIEDRFIYIIPFKDCNEDICDINLWNVYSNRNIGIDFKIYDDVYWGFVSIKVPNLLIIGDVIPSKEIILDKYKTTVPSTIEEGIIDIPDVLKRHINYHLEEFIESTKIISSKQFEKIKDTFDKKQKNK